MSDKDKEGFAKTRGKEDEDMRISYLKEKIEGIEETIKKIKSELVDHENQIQSRTTRAIHIEEILNGLDTTLNRLVDEVRENES